jgi:O-antigen/teichoic acid export membrane protein
MKEFIKSFFSFGVATSIEKIVSFILLPIYTRFFSKEQYGTIDLVQVIVSMSAIFAVLQLESAMQRYYYEYKNKEKKVFLTTIILVVTTLSILLAVILSTFSKSLSVSFFGNDNYHQLIRLALIQLPITNFSVLCFIILRYEKQNINFVLLVLLKVTLSVCLTLLFVVKFGYGIYGIFSSQIIASFVTSVLLFISVKRYFTLELSRTFIKSALKYSLPQFPARIGSILLTYANRFFMIGYLSISAIGVYSLSLKLASSVQLLYTTFIMAWAPYMFKQLKNPNHVIVFPKVLDLVCFPVFFLVIAISLVSKEIIELFTSAEFKEVHLYVGGLSLYFSLLIFKEVVDIGPKFLEKTKYLSYTFFVTLTINIASLSVLVPYFGLKGVVFAMILTNTSLLLISWVVSNKLHFIPYKYVKFVFYAAPAYLISICSLFVTPNILIRYSILVVALIIYAVLFYRHYLSFKSKKFVVS